MGGGGGLGLCGGGPGLGGSGGLGLGGGGLGLGGGGLGLAWATAQRLHLTLTRTDCFHIHQVAGHSMALRLYRHHEQGEHH